MGCRIVLSSQDQAVALTCHTTSPMVGTIGEAGGQGVLTIFFGEAAEKVDEFLTVIFRLGLYGSITFAIGADALAVGTPIMAPTNSSSGKNASFIF